MPFRKSINISKYDLNICILQLPKVIELCNTKLHNLIHVHISV